MTSPFPLPSPEQALAIRDGMLAQMASARRLSLELISDIPKEIWGKFPPGVPTHFAWQVGHLAMAQYGLMLFRQRGRTEGDLKLMPGWFRKKFSRGSLPTEDPSGVPGQSELMTILEDIHGEANTYVQGIDAESLLESTEMPYAAFPIKLGALMFCPLHESLHAGQIGLLRRAFGLDPIR